MLKDLVVAFNDAKMASLIRCGRPILNTKKKDSKKNHREGGKGRNSETSKPTGVLSTTPPITGT